MKNTQYNLFGGNQTSLFNNPVFMGKPEPKTKLKKNIFKDKDAQIIDAFTRILNAQIETKKYPDFKSVLMAMHEAKKVIVSDMKRDLSLMNNPDVFYFQVALSFYKSKFDLSVTTNEGIARHIYNSLVLTGIHSCPDVCYPKVVDILNKKYPEHKQK